PISPARRAIRAPRAAIRPDDDRQCEDFAEIPEDSAIGTEGSGTVTTTAQRREKRFGLARRSGGRGSAKGGCGVRGLAGGRRRRRRPGRTLAAIAALLEIAPLGLGRGAAENGVAVGEAAEPLDDGAMALGMGERLRVEPPGDRHRELLVGERLGMAEGQD